MKRRSKSEWEEAWHRERYSRCRETLLRHLYWACEKDIYRLTRRTDILPHAEEDYSKYIFRLIVVVKKLIFIFSLIILDQFPWIPERNALGFLRPRRGSSRRSSSSITSECCSPIGCTWEEYAEYCPTNKRKSFL